MIHSLKTHKQYFRAVISGRKTFEIRKNDRNFNIGDFLALNEYDAEEQCFTGNSCLVYVDYILNDNEYCKTDYVVMSIKPVLAAKCNHPYNSAKMTADYSVPYATGGDTI